MTDACLSSKESPVGTFRQSLAMALSLILVLLTICRCVAAQNTEAPAFEVASVRMVGPNHGYTKISPAGSVTFSAENASLKYLIEIAFGVDGNLVSAKQNWLDETYYDVTAKPEGTEGLSYEELRPMLQRLLADRFSLRTHREQKMVDGYALLVGKDGFKLKPVDSAAAKTSYILRDGLQAQSITLRTLAGMLASPLGRPVADKTAIEGNYNINLSYAPMNSFDSSLPSVFTAVRTQLGLKVVSQKVVVQMLIVDQVEKLPSEN